MKILHTADWHLGHRLYEKSREDEQIAFLKWLRNTIITQQIEVLIVAGDVFDLPNPPSFAQKMYNDFLVDIKNDGVCKQVVIVRGNHDSAMQLMASQKILKYFNVHVVGSLETSYNDLLVPVIKSNISHEEVSILAVPFLKKTDIVGTYQAHETHKSIEDRAVEMHRYHYSQLVEKVREQGLIHQMPLIATGHLFASGGSVSDSEQPIGIGSLNSLPVSIFPEEINYVALGHLHRPQKVTAQQNCPTLIQYSGSPIQLSFSEKKDIKTVNILTVNKGEISNNIEHLKVPQTVRLERISGKIDTIINNIHNYKSPLTTYAEIFLNVEDYTTANTDYIRTLATKNNIEILLLRSLQNKITSNHTETETYTHQEINPAIVFDKILANSEYQDNEIVKNEMKSLFLSIQQEIDTNATE